jgi:hypothetical protein
LSHYDWRVRRGSAVRRFSDGLVVQGGRRGLLRLWVCRAFSPAAPGAFGLLGPLSAACASEGIRRDTGIISWLHWPNLVTIDGKVVANTSLYLTRPSRPGAKAHAVFEVSVSCFGDSASMPTGLRSTSIAKVLGVEIDASLLREKILHALDWYLAEWERGMLSKLVQRIQPTISWLGQEVDVRTADGRVVKGKAVRLEEGGSLVLEGPVTRKVAPEDVALVRLAH